MSSLYDVAGILPDETVESLPAGTSLLIAGPAMVGKRDLAVELLVAGLEADDGVLCVTTGDNATRIIDEFERRSATLDRDRVGIVDCSVSADREAIEEVATERVSSPGDLTGISIGTAKLARQFAEQDVAAIRHGLVSVSTLLQYVGLDTVFKFIHIYTSRIADTGGFGVFTLDSGSHDPQTVNTVTGEFDGVFELRETESGEREGRLRGIPGTSREWRPV